MQFYWSSIVHNSSNTFDLQPIRANYSKLRMNVHSIAENPISIYPINLWKSLQSILMFPKIFGNLITEFMFLKMIRSKTHSTLEKIGLWWKAHMLEYLSSLVVILTLQFISKYHDIQFNIDWVMRNTISVYFPFYFDTFLTHKKFVFKVKYRNGKLN